MWEKLPERTDGAIRSWQLLTFELRVSSTARQYQAVNGHSFIYLQTGAGVYAMQ